MTDGDDGWRRVCGGIDFGEAPRWRDGRLWYSDFQQRVVCAVTSDGAREVVHGPLDDQPSGLGWLPDGRLLVVSMLRRRVLVEDGRGGLELHADLEAHAPWHCNDMVVDADGTAYVGNFGSDFGVAGPSPTTLVRVRPDGRADVVADDLAFPNGSVITADRRLVVAETFRSRFTVFDIADDGMLTHRRVWADTGPYRPDGCTLDVSGGLWFADAARPRLVLAAEGGAVLDVVATPQPAFACALGGADGRTLFALTAPSADVADVAGRGAGALWARRVVTPGA